MQNQPTLKIDLMSLGNPQCSFCGAQFGSEGMVRDLMNAFAAHVRRQHLDASVSSSPTRHSMHRDHLRTARRA